MQPVVIPSKLEQEYLLRALEAGVRVRTLRQLFLWAQGELQALLPHQALVCLRLDGGGAVRRLECLHGALLAPGAMAVLYDPG
ncbi:helix-turn-helix transcriptional regulator, partial [Massilia horti]